MKRKTTFLAKAFLMLFAVLFSLTGARAQQALPYEYGFENNDLAAEGWTIVDGAGSTGITSSSSYVQNGSYGFQFYYNTNPPQYLISPELTGTESGVTVSFSYKAPGSYVETFKVGYSKTTSDKDAFEWDAEITSPKEWTLYENTFPAGTKYVAVAYTANDQLRLCLDDFSFTFPTAVAKPTGLKVNYEGGTEATISWSSDASAFDIDVNDVVTEDVPNPYTLTGLSLGTTYTIKVRAKEGTDVSGWSAPVSFTTDFPVQTLPYEDGFENGIAAWTLVDCTSGTGLSNTHNGGANGFVFKYNSNPPQYLISPEFEGTSAMTVSFWYRIQNASYPETFQVGYSTTTKDVGEFTWGDEVTATNNNDWLQYEADFPNGTKYVAVRYNSNDMFYLFVDDFSFTVNTGVAKPTGLKVDNIGAKTADLSWAENGEATAWEICLNDDEVNLIPADSNPFTLTGLTPETDYTAKVRAVSGSAKSAWSNEVAFTTDVEFPAPKDLAVVPAAKTAEVSWTGKADSYTLKYRSYADGAVLFSDDFENGMDLWTIYADGEVPSSGAWYTIDPTSGLSFDAHSGTNCTSSWSWNSSAFNANNWLVTPKVAFGGLLKFWVRTNAGYPDSYEVLLSTTDNAEASFTVELQAMAAAPNNGEWNEVVIDLSAYAGEEGFIAFHHVSNDCNYLVIDDVVITDVPVTGDWVTISNATSPYTIEGLTPETQYQVEVQGVYAGGESEWVATSFTTLEDVPTPSALAVSDVTWGTAKLSWTENGEATAWEVCLNGDETNLISADSNPFTVEGLTPETEYTAKVRAVNGQKTSKWSDEVTFTTDIRFYPPTNLAVNNITTTSAEISWDADAAATSAVLEYADATGAPLVLTEYKYDNGTFASALGISAEFSCAAMFPAGSFTGSTLSKVSLFDASAAEATVTIYSGGDAEPETAIASKDVSLTAAGDFVEVDFGVSLNPTQNVWVVVTFPSGGYYAVASDELGDANGRWSNLGSGWVDLASVGGSGYCWMVRAIFATPDPSALTWTTVADATAPYELTGLTPETTYAVRVKSVFADGESKWTSTTFKTLSENPVPANIVADLAADGATLTWDGKGESYNVQYRTAEGVNPLFEDDFANSNLGDWTTVNLENGGGVMDGGIFAFKWTSNPPQYLVSPELTGIAAGNILTFNYRCYDANYPETFKVGYSTTTNDVENDFTWSTEVTAGSTSPQVYTLTLPADVKYISIQCTSDDMYYFIIDGISIYDVIPASAWQDMAVTDKTATISGLDNNNILYEYQVQSVKGGNTSAWSAIQDFALMTLDSDADNTSVINAFNGKQAHVTLANRTLYQDNTWNTICLPFDMTLAEVDASPLAGGDVRTLTDNITVENESVTLNFTAEGEALTTWGGNTFFGGVPYIVKWASGSGIVNPEFANVTITADKYYVGDNTKVKFEGTYAPIDFAAEEKSILFIGADNKFNYPLAGAKIGAMRGYFELIGYTAGEGNGVKIFTNLDDDDATGIANIEKAENTGDWYDISGRKLAGKPSVKGIYVNGGRKVTIK